jgi:hypothetical protein
MLSKAQQPPLAIDNVGKGKGIFSFGLTQQFFQVMVLMVH